MSRKIELLPFECTVEGSPISHQASDRAVLADWKKEVRSRASKNWDADPIEEASLMITVVYFFAEYDGGIDNDNMLKPIQDALQGVIYTDDNLLIDTRVARRNIDAKFRVRGISKVLGRAFSRGNEFVYLRIEQAPDPADLL